MAFSMSCKIALCNYLKLLHLISYAKNNTDLFVVMVPKTHMQKYKWELRKTVTSLS